MSDYCERRSGIGVVSHEGGWTRHDIPCGCVSRVRATMTETGHIRTGIGLGSSCGKPMRPLRFYYSDPIPDMHRLVEAAWDAVILRRLRPNRDFGSTSGASEGHGYVYRYGDKWRRMAEWQRDRERRAWSAKATPGKRRHRR